ncbi:HNH endonuclease [Candidatus Woesearchaeota archaeon]|nr:HNH endonuclease [Candidatus Woesearchaeota archaeon]
MELRHRESIISKKCLQCDQIFEMLKSENKIFCSTKCLGKYRKENGMYLGSKNPRWLGGSSKYRGRDWNTKRLECLERDNFKCCKCNENNIVLHVHHIIPYRKTKNNDLENLIVLCVKCHNAEEATYRKYGIIGWLKNELQSM